MSSAVRPAGTDDAEAFSVTVAIGFDGYRAFAPQGWLPPDAMAPGEVVRVRERLAAPGTWGLRAEADGEWPGTWPSLTVRSQPNTRSQSGWRRSKISYAVWQASSINSHDAFTERLTERTSAR